MQERLNGPSRLASLNPQVLAVVRNSELGERLGEDGLVFNLETAVARHLARGDAV